jgi:hypothetical protein
MGGGAKHVARQPLARNLLGSRAMRRLWLPLLLLAARTARGAVEISSDLSANDEFVYLTTDAAGELADGAVALGAGFALISDGRLTRVGARGLAEWRGERLRAGLQLGWAPKQAGLGWMTAGPHAGVRGTRGRVALDGELRLNLRRMDAGARPRPLTIDQIQLEAEGTLTVDERWEVGATALGSFYDPALDVRGLRRADLGLLVTTAGRPERWAVALRAARQLRRVRLQLGLGGVAFAGEPGGALTPRAAIRAGPFGGVSCEASAELVLGIAAAARDPPRAIGGLAVEYTR